MNEYNIDVNIGGIALGCENCICIPYTKDNNNHISLISSLLNTSDLIWSNLTLKDDKNNDKIGKILFRIVKMHPHFKFSQDGNDNDIKIFIVSKDLLEFVRMNNSRFCLNFSSIHQDVKDIIRDHLYVDWYKVPIVKYIRLTKIQYKLPSNVCNKDQDSVLKINDTSPCCQPRILQDRMRGSLISLKENVLVSTRGYNNQRLFYHAKIEMNDNYNEEKNDYLYAQITSTTQIIIISDDFLIENTLLIDKDIASKNPILNSIYEYHDPFVISLVGGIAKTVFTNKFCNKETTHSILLESICDETTTSLLLNVANEFNSPIIRINAGLLYGRGYENADILLRQYLQASLLQEPCIIYFDDIDVLVPSSTGVAEVTDTAMGIMKVLSAILTQLSKEYSPSDSQYISSTQKVIVVGRTSKFSLVHSSILKLFQERFAIPLPTAKHRRQIAKSILSRLSEVDNHKLESDLDEVYSFSDNLVGLSLISLVNELIKAIPEFLSKNKIDKGKKDKESLFKEIIGHDSIKSILEESIILPRKYPNILKSFHVRADAGILLFGPPGTGKTMFPRVIAHELGCPLINMQITDVIKSEIGAGEKAVMNTFAEARKSAPCIVFIDEFQAMFSSRASSKGNWSSGDTDEVGSSLSSTLASCFDDINNWNTNAGNESLVTIIAATNEPWALDSGFLRAGRFDRVLFVGPLDELGRTAFILNTLNYLSELFNITINEEELKASKWFEEFLFNSEGYTGADMDLLNVRFFRLLKNDTSLENIKDIIISCLKDSKSSTTIDDLELYYEWNEIFGRIR